MPMEVLSGTDPVDAGAERPARTDVGRTRDMNSNAIARHTVGDAEHAPSSEGKAARGSTGYAGALSLVGAGFIVRLAADVAGVLATAATLVLAVRLLGPPSYGRMALALATVDLVTALGRFGFGLGAAQTVAAAGSDRGTLRVAAQGAMTLAVVTGALSGLVVLACIVLGLVGGDASTRLVVGIGLAVFLAGNNYSWGVFSIARGLGRIALMELIALLIPIGQLLTLIALAVAHVPSLTAVAVGFGAAGAIGAAVSALVLRTLLPGVTGLYRPSAAAGRTMLRIALPFSVAGIAFQLIGQFDVLVLGIVRSKTDVALYQPTLKLTDGLMNLIPFLLAGAYIPAATRLFKRADHGGFKDLFIVTTKVGYVLGFPAILALAAFPDVLLRTLYGAHFQARPSLVWILLVGYVANLLLGINTVALMSTGDRRRVVHVNVVAMSAMAVLALVLIPWLGIAGGALATMGSYLAWNAAATTALFRSTGVHPFRRDVCIAAASSLAALAAGLLVRHFAHPATLWSVALWTLLVWGTWAAILWGSGVIGGDELAPLLRRKQRQTRREFLADVNERAKPAPTEIPVAP
jgi:O-antigen/teichoic acid export membrane protein